MSAIQRELTEATGVKETKGETRDAFLDKVMMAVRELPEKKWDALSDEAADWYNNAMDRKNANIKNPAAARPIDDFPDYKPAEPARGRRRSADAEDQPKADLAPGATATVVTSRDKTYTGEVVEVSDADLVLRVDGEELEFSRAKLKSVEVAGAAAGSGPEPEGPREPAIGDIIVIVTTRDKTYEGEVIEADAENLVLKVGSEELEFDPAKLKSVEVKKWDAAAAPEPAGRTRARAGAKDKETVAEEDKRSSNPRGISIGGRIREIMAESLDTTLEQVVKQLNKEGLNFRDTSANMIYRDTKQFLELLKANKKIK